jgi:hypothetical protein
MHDIFISYAREDKPRAEQLLGMLSTQGWTVWWDAHIPGGKPFHDKIQEALTTARCVIVLWTTDSVKSDWVRDEADVGKSRGVLVPLLLDRAVEIPLGFRSLQTIDLSDAGLVAEGEAWNAVLSSVRLCLEGEKAVLPPPEIKPPWGLSRRVRDVLVFIALPTVLAVAVAGGAALWKVPTAVKVQLGVSGVELWVAEGGPAEILHDPPPLRVVEFENFASIRGQVVGGGLELAGTGREEGPKWRPASVNGAFRLERKSGSVSRLEASLNGETGLGVGQLAGLLGKPGKRVILEAAAAMLRIAIEDSDVRLTFRPSKAAEYRAENVTIPGDPRGSGADIGEVRARLRLQDGAPFLEVYGSEAGVRVGTEFDVPGGPASLEVLARAPVHKVQALKWQGTQPVSSALADGTLDYPDFPELRRITLRASDALVLEGLAKGSVSTVSFDPQRGQLLVEVQAILSESGGDSVRDYRLSAFEALRQKPTFMALVSVGAWAASVLIGLYRLLRA